MTQENVEGQEEMLPGTGIGGTADEVLAARDFTRLQVIGAAAHAGFARKMLDNLRAASDQPVPGRGIADTAKLKAVAGLLGIQAEGKATEDIARDVVGGVTGDFGRQDGVLPFIARAPEPRRAQWQKLGILPGGIDRENVEILSLTNIGAVKDHRAIMQAAARAALADGWGSSMIATELQDIIFGTPSPTKGSIQLEKLSKTAVNIVVQTENSALLKELEEAASDTTLLKLAKNMGADGINVTGLGCGSTPLSPNIKMPVSGDLLLQELAVSTGAVECLLVEEHRVMPSLPELCNTYHTGLITTAGDGTLPEGTNARDIVKKAVMNFQNRTDIYLPDKSSDVTTDFITGFSAEAVVYMLGGRFRPSVVPLFENVINGRIKGVAAIVGGGKPNPIQDAAQSDMIKELVANDILVVQTGTSTAASARAGLLLPEAVDAYAGSGLAEVCHTVGIPPVLHVGSFLDSNRLLIALSEVARAGGSGVDISLLPAAGAAPGWLSERAVSIGYYFVASGVHVVLGDVPPLHASDIFLDHLLNEQETIYGAKWAAAPEPPKMAEAIINHIQLKRKNLGIDKSTERVLYDMEMRRELEA
jgi:anaerobic carbon-monoxide dehydrogenase catalytic subunit